MTIEQILLWIRIVGAVASFVSIPLVAQTIYMGLATPVKALKQHIIDTTPEPEPEPIPMKKVIVAQIPREVQAKLDDLLPAAELRPGWDRIGGVRNENAI